MQHLWRATWLGPRLCNNGFLTLSRVSAITAQIEHEANRLIMAALFGRLDSLGRFSLLLQLRFQTEGGLMEKSLLARSDADGLELFTACLWLWHFLTHIFIRLTELRKNVHSFSLKRVNRGNQSETLFSGCNKRSSSRGCFLSGSSRGTIELSRPLFVLAQRWNIFSVMNVSDFSSFINCLRARKPIL